MDKLLQQPGVTELGRHGVDEVVRAKCAAGFHLYFSKSEAETDCISIRESTVAGCKISIFLIVVPSTQDNAMCSSLGI